MRKIINVIAFQIGWFAAVLGAAHDMPWLGVVVVPLALGLHLVLSPDWRPELLLALGAAVTGFLCDTLLVLAGVFSPVLFLLPAPLSPPWMVMLWINLATTLNVSLGSLRDKYIFAGVLGAVGGPMAYYSGAKLGAMTVIPPVSSLLAIGAAWAFAFPALFKVNDMIRKQFTRGKDDAL